MHGGGVAVVFRRRVTRLVPQGLLPSAQSVRCWRRPPGQLWLPLQIRNWKAVGAAASQVVAAEFELVLRTRHFVHQLERALGQGRLVALRSHSRVRYLRDGGRSEVRILVIGISVRIYCASRRLRRLMISLSMVARVDVGGSDNCPFILISLHFGVVFIFSTEWTFPTRRSFFVAEVLRNCVHLVFIVGSPLGVDPCGGRAPLVVSVLAHEVFDGASLARSPTRCVSFVGLASLINGVHSLIDPILLLLLILRRRIAVVFVTH